MKSQSFLNIFTIFNQLHNFHCLHNLCNGKTKTKMAQTNDNIAYANAISSKTQKFSVQPNTWCQWQSPILTLLSAYSQNVLHTIENILCYHRNMCTKECFYKDISMEGVYYINQLILLKMAVFWVVAQCRLVLIVLMMEAASTSETSVNLY
jgi:hypothetical protein